MKDISAILEKDNLIVDKSITYLRNVSIIEYDIADAGFNIIKFMKLLDADEISYLETIPKQSKNIRIGKLQARNKDLIKNMLIGFRKIRKWFGIVNNLSETDILTIKKDAIYLINKSASFLKLDNYFEFKIKNRYTSYLYINNKEFYFNGKDRVDVKGITDVVTKQQSNYLIKDIMNIMRIAESSSRHDVIYKYLKSYRAKYLNRELPIDTYRNIDTGRFDLLNKSNYAFDKADDSMIHLIDISHNYVNYLVPIFKNIL